LGATLVGTIDCPWLVHTDIITVNGSMKMALQLETRGLLGVYVF